MRRILCLFVAAFAAIAVGTSLTKLSSATFTAQTGNGATVSAKSDWATPTVSLTNPGGIVQGAVTISATASDDRSAIANVVIEYAVADSNNWVPMCAADTTAPYSCAWNTAAIADGFYDLRATATDTSGYSATSDVVTTRVVNLVNVILTNPGDNLRGTVALQAKLYGAPSSTTISIEFKKSSASSWSSISGCTTALSTTLNCSWSTSSLTDVYDIRAKAVVVITTYTDVAADIQVDNTPPTVTMTAPASPLSGATTLTSTSADADAGMSQVQYSYAPNGTSTWTTACTATSSPYSCSFNSVGVVDGTYSFRAIGTDAAGNLSTVSVVNNIVLDNTVASVSVGHPGDLLSGTATVNVNANSSNGVASVTVQRAVAGSSTFTDICTDPTSPYGCAWDTTLVTDGAYDLRAVMTQGNGALLTSAVVTTAVSNSPLKGVDIQTVNGGTSSGKLEAGDKIVFTFSQHVDPATVLTGWNGAARSVVAWVRDGQLVGGGATADQLTVDSVNLGVVKLNGNFVKKLKSVPLTATVTIATQEVKGVNRSVVTITLNVSPVTADASASATSAAAMTWSPSSLTTDHTGRACSTAVVTESGSLDKDF